MAPLGAVLKEPSDQGPHCLPVCKNGFEKFARIFSRRHKQMAFSDASFLGILRVKVDSRSLVSKQNCLGYIEK